jgi:hypothetical protein
MFTASMLLIEVMDKGGWPMPGPVAETGSEFGDPRSTFRSEIDAGQVVCLGPISRSRLQLSRIAAETCIGTHILVSG